MPLTVVDGPAAIADPVVTITVQITVVGDELPPAASRLVTNLEALLAHGSAELAAASRYAASRVTTEGPPQLRLVEPDSRARRIAGGSPDAPTLCLRTGSRLVLCD